MRFLRVRGLLTANLVLCLLFLAGLVFTGHAQENAELADHGQPPESLLRYVGSSSFGEAVFENWESEFLQMGMYVLLTAYLVQKGSAESRPPKGSAAQDEDPRAHRDDRDAPWPVRRGSPLILKLYENSLAIAFGLVFLLSLAERVPCRSGHCGRIDLPAPAPLRPVQTGPRTTFGDRRLSPRPLERM